MQPVGRRLRVESRGIRLFLTSRSAAWHLAICGVLATVTGVLGDTVVQVPGAHDGTGVPLTIPTATIAPLAFATITVYFQRTRLGQQEAMSVRRLAMWAFAHFVVAALAAGLLLAIAARDLEQPFGMGVVLRNYLAMTAVGFACSMLVRPEFAWIGPALVTFAFLSVLGGVPWNPLLSTGGGGVALVALAGAVVAVAALAARRRFYRE